MGKKADAALLDAPQGSGDENWIYSFSDMMSLLLCFFILLYKATVDEDKMRNVSKLISESMRGVDSQVNPEAQIEESDDKRQQRAFELLVSMLNLGDTVSDAVGNIEQKFTTLKSAEALKGSIEGKLRTEDRDLLQFLEKRDVERESVVVFTVPDTVAFPSGGVEYSESGTAIVSQIAKLLLSYKNVLSIEVSGHTDSVPFATAPKSSLIDNNWALSAHRAANTIELLAKNGLAGMPMKAIGLADTQPIISPAAAPGSEPEKDRMAKNRRIEIRVNLRPSEVP